MAKYIINTDMIPVEIPNKSDVVTFFGEPVQELITCRECRFWPDNQMMAIVPRKNGKTDFNAMLEIENRCLHMGPEDYCSKADRRKHVG